MDSSDIFDEVLFFLLLTPGNIFILRKDSRVMIWIFIKKENSLYISDKKILQCTNNGFIVIYRIFQNF